MGTSTRWFQVLVATVAALVAAGPAPADAASLAGKLGRFVQDNTGIFTVGGIGDFVTPAIQRLAIRGIDFPHTSTAPGFSYRFDFDSASYVRETLVLGPVFSERPETIGRHRLELGVSFLWGDLDRVDGGSLGTASTGLFRVADSSGEQLDVVTALTFDRFSLNRHRRVQIRGERRGRGPDRCPEWHSRTRCERRASRSRRNPVASTACNGNPFPFGDNAICSLAMEPTLDMTGTYSLAVSDAGVNETGTYVVQLELVPAGSPSPLARETSFSTPYRPRPTSTASASTGRSGPRFD